MALTDKQRLLIDVGADESTFTDDELTDFFTRAATEYPTASDEAQYRYARLLAVGSLLAAAIRAGVKYKQGDSTEDTTPVTSGLRALQALYKAEFEAELARTAVPVVWGPTRRKPKRLKEYPDE